MRKDRELAILLIILLADFVRSDVFYNFVNREDPCNALCEKTPSSFVNSKYVKSCCQRGCRFFNLVDLRFGQDLSSLNGTRDACEASCTEAYSEPQDRNACSTGCDFMAKQRVSDLLSLFSIAIYVEEGIDSNILLMSPDIPDNDILTDPGLRKELLPRWWDSDGFKLPQTYIKSVPIDAGTVDYGIPSDYSGETEQSVSLPGSDWLQCASRHTGIPHWLLASAIAAAALSAFWLCLSPERTNDIPKVLLIDKTNSQNKVTVYIPDEEPLHKKPPPKYIDVGNVGDINLKT